MGWASTLNVRLEERDFPLDIDFFIIIACLRQDEPWRLAVEKRVYSPHRGPKTPSHSGGINEMTTKERNIQPR